MSHSPARSATRYSVDEHHTIGFPIVPVGDSPKLEGRGARRVAEFAGIGWRIEQPYLTNGRLPSSAVLDVYVGLMFLFKLAGFPEDGRVYFSRYRFLLLIGWLSSSRGPRGRVIKPSGRHYRQLAAALEYLESTRLVNRNADVEQIGPDGRAFRGQQGFPILQYHRMADEPRGRCGEGGRNEGGASMVQFSDAFRMMVGGGANTTKVDLDLFLSLPSGSARPLFRLFCWMRRHAIRRIRVSEVLQRIGSTQAHCVPARARQVLDKAHGALRERGVLTGDPVYVKAEGEYWIEYSFGDPRVLLDEEEALIAQAIAYGVVPATARELAVANRPQMERVLAATTLGLLHPRRTVAAMVVHYTRRGIDIEETGRRIEDAIDSQVSLDLDTRAADVRYLAWCKQEREARSARRADLSVSSVRHEIEVARQERGLEDAPWLSDGLVAMRLNALLRIPDLGIYRSRVLVAA